MPKTIKTYIIHFTLLLSFTACKKEVKNPSFYPSCGEDNFWWTVMMAESGGNSRAVHMEPWGEESLGLYQLSVSDSKRYKDCPKTRDEYFDPKKNTKCKNSIINTLRAKYPDKNIWEVGGMYWAVLRNPTYWEPKLQRPQSWKNFKYFAAKKRC